MPDHFERLKSALADRYAIDREIDRGGMATVYLARDVKHDRHVAIKVLHPEIAASVGHERFLREIQIAARLEHPNILTLIDSGEAAGLPYFVMPYLEGGSLRDRLDREGELPIDEALQLAAEVADGLDYAHEQGVVHRDIKPSNILLYRGHALIADFGVARALDLAGSGATVTGLAVGTPKYMSPEQAAGKADIDGRSDIYGLACVLWEMLAGEAPYDGPTPHAIMARKVTEDTPSLRIRRRTVTRELENVLAKAMARSPADRFATAGEFAKALKTRGVGVRRPSRVSAAQRKRLAIGVTAVAVLAIAGFAWWQNRESDDAPPALDELGVVILPFTEQGNITGSLDGDSIATALSLLFRATDRYQARRQGEVRAAVARDCPAGVSDICALNVAQALGSSLFVTGRVTATRGDSVQVLAEMVDVTGERAIPVVTVEGSRRDFRSLQQELATQLWLAPVGEGQREILLADVTTPSPEALAAFLDGEIYFDKWDLRRARQAYEEAVAIDSTFAMAWYRLGIIWDWDANPPRVENAFVKAIDNSDRLPDRNRRAVTAFFDMSQGRVDEAERAYRQLLEDDPDDVLVNYGLGLLLWGYNWRRGRPMSEAIEPFRKVLRSYPANESAAIYLMWALADEGSYAAMNSLNHSLFNDDRWSAGIELIRAHREGDSTGFRAMADSIYVDPVRFDPLALATPLYWAGTHRGDVPDLTWITREQERWVDSANLSLALGEPGSYLAMRVWNWLYKSRNEAAQGMFRSAMASLESMDSLSVSVAPPNMALIATLPLPAAAQLDTIGLAARIRSWYMPQLSWPSGTANLLTLTHQQTEHLARPYALGLLAAAEGDYESALGYASQLESLGPHFPQFPAVPRDLAQSLRADVLLRQGLAADAIEAIESADWHVNYNEPFGTTIFGHRDGYLKALALKQLGRHEEALAYFEFGMGQNLNTFLASILLAPSHFHRAEIYEGMGDIDQAIWHYEAFAELWKDADPELQPKVREVLQHVAELRGETVDVTTAES